MVVVIPVPEAAVAAARTRQPVGSAVALGQGAACGRGQQQILFARQVAEDAVAKSAIAHAQLGNASRRQIDGLRPVDADRSATGVGQAQHGAQHAGAPASSLSFLEQASLTPSLTPSRGKQLAAQGNR